MNHCIRHYEEPTVALCRTCQRSFCSRCLVFAFGPTKPPYCVGCALAASGVRNGVRVPVAAAPAPSIDRKAEKAQRKAEKAATKAHAKAAKVAARSTAPPTALGHPEFDPRAPRPAHVPGPSQLTLATGRPAPGMQPHI